MRFGVFCSILLESIGIFKPSFHGNAAVISKRTRTNGNRLTLPTTTIWSRSGSAYMGGAAAGCPASAASAAWSRFSSAAVAAGPSAGGG